MSKQLTRRPDGLYAPSQRVNGRKITGYGKTVTAARADLAEKVRRALGGLPSRDSNTTVGAWIDTFVTTVLPESGRRPKTVELYGSSLRTHVRPQVGHVRLRDLAQHHVLAVVKAMRAVGKANSTVGTMVIAAKSMTKAAKEARMIAADPLADMKIPTRATTK